jgi:hypothetical protein
VLEAGEQGELVDEDGADGVPSGADEPAGRHRAVDVEDALELAAAASLPATVLRGGRLLYAA